MNISGDGAGIASQNVQGAYVRSSGESASSGGGSASKRESSSKGVSSSKGRSSSKGGGHLRLTSLWLLVMITVSISLACFFALDIWLRAGRSPLSVPLVSFAAPICMAVFIGWQGWRVRSYQRGARPLEALEAGRIFLLAQSGSRAGAVLLGGALGAIMAYAHSGPTSFLAEQMFHLALAGLASFLLVVVSYICERWCIVDGSDGEQGSHPRHGGRGSAAPA